VRKVCQAWEEVDTRIRCNDEAESTEPPFDLDEIKKSPKEDQEDSTPGPDGVKYSDIKCLDIKGKAEIAKQVNGAIMKGEIPTDWRDCNMAVLPKPNKDHTKLNGYRIITMANVWIKIIEKVVAGRIVRDLGERGCLTPNVGGARPRRSTTSNLDTTTHRIQQSMQRHQHTAVELFDLIT
jgi:hypothetical protein